MVDLRVARLRRAVRAVVDALRDLIGAVEARAEHGEIGLDARWRSRLDDVMDEAIQAERDLSPPDEP